MAWGRMDLKIMSTLPTLEKREEKRRASVQLLKHFSEEDSKTKSLLIFWAIQGLGLSLGGGYRIKLIDITVAQQKVGFVRLRTCRKSKY
ncbi:unnamed protein product [Ilex paraguariensis]|uniref:Uncharacterized protein n=1 Tax=Ilex paraguariensis TaxID=185542 RepID=A0ABC8U3H3_9AQUA